MFHDNLLISVNFLPAITLSWIFQVFVLCCKNLHFRFDERGPLRRNRGDPIELKSGSWNPIPQKLEELFEQRNSHVDVEATVRSETQIAVHQ